MSRPAWADPRGKARSDYRWPCPGCGAAPRKGEKVVKVCLRGSTRGKWWHESCRSAYVGRLLHGP